jgi:hypothetical protein
VSIWVGRSYGDHDHSDSYAMNGKRPGGGGEGGRQHIIRQINFTNNDSYDKRRLTPIRCKTHVNLVKMKILEGRPNKIAKRGNVIILGNTFPCQEKMHEIDYEK